MFRQSGIGSALVCPCTFQRTPQRILPYIQLPRHLPEGYSLAHQLFVWVYGDLSQASPRFSMVDQPSGSRNISPNLSDSLKSLENFPSERLWTSRRLPRNMPTQWPAIG